MRLLVHALGAWMAAQAADGRYPRPVAIGLTMLIARLGTPTAMIALAGFAIKKLDEAGAFETARKPAAVRRARPRRA